MGVGHGGVRRGWGGVRTPHRGPSDPVRPTSSFQVSEGVGSSDDRRSDSLETWTVRDVPVIFGNRPFVFRTPPDTSVVPSDVDPNKA